MIHLVVVHFDDYSYVLKAFNDIIEAQEYVDYINRESVLYTNEDILNDLDYESDEFREINDILNTITSMCIFGGVFHDTFLRIESTELV